MRITAAVLRERTEPYVLEELELPSLGPNQVLVRIISAGYCHTDFLGRVPEFELPLPLVLGHEGAGIVEGRGECVTGVAIGDHVVCTFDSCGSCESCILARPSYCATFMERNISGAPADGAVTAHDKNGDPVATRWFQQSSFATYAVTTERNIVVVDRDLPLEKIGPLGCGIQTGAGAILNSFRVRPGQDVAVYGVGAVGLAAVMAAKVAGAKQIIAIDLNEKRRAAAHALGATHTVNGADTDIVDQVLDVSGGCHYAVDTTGIPTVIASAVATLRTTGVCGLIGAIQGSLTLDPMILSVGRSVRGILEGDAVPQHFIPQLIELWKQGRFPFDQLIETYPLSRINDAERDALEGRVIKPVLLPHG